MTRPAWADTFETHAQSLLDLYRCPGLAIGLAEQGEMTYFHGFGCRDVADGLPMTPDTVMGIASITKSFTAVAIMQLQEAGRLSVLDPVVRYLPEFRTPDPAHTRAVTLHHLMTHTAGLPPLPTLLHAMVRSMKADPSVNAGDALEKIQPVDTYAEMLDLIAATPFELLGPPGTRFSYSNDSFALLGAVVEHVSGIPFARYLKERILGPAGMTRTTIETADLEGLADVATLYATQRKEGGAPDETEVRPAPGWWEVGPAAAAGHMRSTIHDMLRYADLYRAGGTVGGVRILSEASVRAMTTPHVEFHDGSYYGYGLQVAPSYHGLSLVEHGGALKGISSHMTIAAGRGLTGVVLNNLAGVPSGDILLAALNAAAGLPLATRRFEANPYPCTTEELARYTGEYPATEGVPGMITVWLEEGKLMAKSTGGLDPMPLVELMPIGPARFVIKVKESLVRIRFHFDGTGQVWAASIGLRLVRKARA